ncbi:Transposase DDE domain protein [Planctomycetes bacterium CA13]|uniref:Transposase DDE domain protein n=1 Tax=Novipirellula herctigrandis TaxID=2527986 RepID=A0A5C5Z0J1_9BACT|nr:Transposase DDE domain protein [Planctomycetes bacterium CA13]TWT80042.1 Transposase DDE domain protein [Planctomycetes bacterium CA13]TWT80367.1 Transposase DDE domain protein [Planctomycetes bacterium CA13]
MAKKKLPKCRKPAGFSEAELAPGVTAKRPNVESRIDAKDITGLKFFKRIRPLLESLHSVGAQRDKAGSRDLHMDQYGVLVLMWLFNPILSSLRGLQQASELETVQKKFGVGRASLSESVTIFDPEPLKEIAASLATQIPSADPSRFDGIKDQLTAVDGSVFKTAVRVASLSWIPSTGRAAGRTTTTAVDGYRMHTHFEILRGVPERVDATPAKPKGKDDEKIALASVLQPDRCYVTDRGYAKFELFNAIHAADSSYICRLRDNSTPKRLKERPLTDADRAAGVRLDCEVILGAHTSNRKTIATDHPVRYIEIEVPSHVRTGKGGANSDGILRVATSLMDVPAELIAEAYRLRWLIELFFRMIKQLLGCRHLLSTKPNGVEIQMYLAIIACFLILIYTGGQPNKRTYEMICFYLLGWASLQELEAHIKKLKSKNH